MVLSAFHLGFCVPGIRALRRARRADRNRYLEVRHGNLRVQRLMLYRGYRESYGRHRLRRIDRDHCGSRIDRDYRGSLNAPDHRGSRIALRDLDHENLTVRVRPSPSNRQHHRVDLPGDRQTCRHWNVRVHLVNPRLRSPNGALMRTRKQ